MKKIKVLLSDLICENGSRFKPNAKEIKGFQRVDKIDFSGKIQLSNCESRTDMIIVNPDDLLISGINVEKGALSIYRGNEPVAATIHYSSYKINRKRVDPTYLILFLRSTCFLNRLRAHVPGGIKTEIKAKHLLPLDVEIHQLKDQIKVLEQVDELDEEISLLNKELLLQDQYIKNLKADLTRQVILGEISKNNNLHEIRNLLAQYKLTPKLESKIEVATSSNEGINQFDLPRGVEWVKLGSILISGPTNGYSPRGVEKDTGKKVLTLTATTYGKFCPEYFKYFIESISDNSDLWLKRNDILIQRGNTVEYVGIAALVDQEVRVIYPDLMIKINVLPEINPEYIVAFLNSSFGREYAMKNAKGAQKTMPKINQGVILSWPIIIPPRKCQDEIVKKIKSLDSLVLNAELEHKNARNIKNEFIISAKEKVLDL